MKKLILLLFLLSIVITGCGDNDELDLTQAPFLGGTIGLIINFEPMGVREANVYTIYEDEMFPIQLVLKNQGEQDIRAGDAKVTLRGIDINDFTGIQTPSITTTQLIEGRSKDFNPMGGEIIVSLGNRVRYNRPIAGSEVPLDIIVDVEYNYKTRVTVPRVCFKEDLRDLRGCDIEGPKTFFNSGGPIQVKAVRQERAGRGLIALVFEVENVGTGRSAVPGKEFSTAYNYISYEIQPASERALWTCRSALENEARLIDNKATIRCTLNEPMPEGTLVIKEINLDINYDYQQRVIQSLKVRRTA